MSAQTKEEDWADLPLFAPEGAKIPDETTAEDAPAVSALSHMMYDEETPEEASELLREQGNRSFKLGKPGYKRAIEQYTAAIKAAKGSPVMLSAYLNRANAQSRLGNLGYALDDAKRALDIDDRNLKALYRGATCAMQLRRFEECVRYCDIAREIGEAGIFEGMREKAAGIMEREKRQAHTRKERDEKVDNMLSEHGIRIGAPLFEMQKRYAHTEPRWDDGWTWPLMIVYIAEDIERSDYIPSVEENVTMEDILFIILSDTMDWDHNRLYSSPAGVDLRFRKDWTVIDGGDVVGSDVCEPGNWITVGRNVSLLELLKKKEYVTPMFPVLYAVPKGWKG